MRLIDEDLHPTKEENASNTNLLLGRCVELHDIADRKHDSRQIDDAVGDRVAQEIKDGVDALRGWKRLQLQMPEGCKGAALKEVGNLNGDCPQDTHGTQDVAAPTHGLCGEDAPVEGEYGELHKRRAEAVSDFCG